MKKLLYIFLFLATTYATAQGTTFVTGQTQTAQQIIDSINASTATIDASRIANLPSSTPADGSITEAKLADNSVTNTKIPTNTISTVQIQNSAISGIKILDGAVTISKIATDLNDLIGTKTTTTYVDNAVASVSVPSTLVPSNTDRNLTTADFYRKLTYSGSDTITYTIPLGLGTSGETGEIITGITTGTGAIKFKPASGVTYPLYKSKTGAGATISMIRVADNSWLPLNTSNLVAYNNPPVVPTNLYTGANALGSDINSIGSLTSVAGTATISSVASTLSADNYMIRVLNNGGGQQGLLVTQAGLTIGRTYRFTINVDNSLGYGALMSSSSTYGTVSYVDKGVPNNTTNNVVFLDVVANATTVGVTIGWSSAGQNGNIINVKTMVITDVTP